MTVILNTTTIVASTPTFSAATDFTVGGANDSKIATADFNGDGKPDIVASESFTSTISVLLNTTTNGASTPTFSTYTSFTTGNGPFDVTTSDINGDGKPDIVTANIGTNTVSVLLNTTSNGAATPSFSSKTDFTVGSSTYRVAISDFNGDGKPDVVTVNAINNSTVSVLLNTTSNGASTPTFTSKTDFAVGAVGNYNYSVTIGDINGDNKPDIISANYSASTVAVLLNTTSNGAATPTFSAKTDFAVGTSPNWITIVDFDGDGKSDIATSNNIASGTVSVLLNTTTNGASTPSFSAKTDFAVGAYPSSVINADINGDNKPDIITTNSPNASVLLNTTSFPSAITWDGSESANWDTGDNWSTSVVPIAEDNVTIPDVATNDPIISSADAVCNHLTISWGALVTINAGYSLSVDGALINNAGTGGLVIQSTSGGTGSMIFPSGTPNATVQRYVTTTEWNMVTPSTTGVTGQTFFDASANDSWLTWFDESVGTNGGSAGAGWEYLTTLSDAVYVGQGYTYYPSANETVEFAGNLRSADLSPTITYTDGTKGYNVIGNPFPSAVDWNSDASWVLTNVEGTIWIYDGSAYQSYTQATSHDIPVGQGFFVHATGSNPAITIPASQRNHTNPTFLKRPESGIGEYENALIIKAQNNQFEDKVQISFQDNGTEGFDNGWDGTKMYGSPEAPQLYLVENNLNQSYDHLPNLVEGEERIVTMSYIPGASGQQQLIADFTYFQETHVTLEDLQTSTTRNLNENPVYVFNGTKDDDPDRFLLHFAWSPDGIGEDMGPDSNIDIYSYEKDVYIQSEVYNQGEITVYDMFGRTIYKNKYHNSMEKIRLDINNSFVVVRVVTQHGVKSEKVYIK